LGLVTPEESALVQLIGQKLAERALQNIPQALRDQLHTWWDGYEAQMALLRLIRDTFKSAAWNESDTRSYAYNSDARCVLPAETGSWKDGLVKPNCLGMAQMIVGIFQAIGAIYYLANTLRANQDTLHDWKLRTLRGTVDTLRQYAEMDVLTAKIQAAYIEALQDSTTEYMAHHVVVVITDDGASWVIDPYLDALYPLAESQSRHEKLTFISTARNRLLTTNNPSSALDLHLSKLQMVVNVVQFMCTIIELRHNGQFAENPLDTLSFAAAHARLRDAPTGNHREFSRELTFLHARCLLKKDTTHPALAQLALRYAMDDSESLKELAATIKKSPAEARIYVKRGMARAAKDRNYEQHVAVRLVRFTLKHLMKELDNLPTHPEARGHESLEIGWAPMVLGIATLNYMQFEQPVGTPTLRGQLAKILPSQWAMYDALAIAEQRGEPIGPDDLAAFAKHLERFGDDPELLIVPWLLRMRSNRHG
jgi:hypothetical protein